LENIHTKPENANEIKNILTSSLNSFVLRILQENAQELNLTTDYTVDIVEALITIILSPDEKGSLLEGL